MTRAERSERTRELLVAAQDTDNEVERDRLLDEVVLINRGVAEAVAARYRGRGVPAEDLQQAAYEGLIKAVHKFDPSVRPDLLTYAVPTIRGEVQRWFRDQSWMVRPPRRIQELQWRISRSIDHLSQDLGRPPSDQEVSDDVGCSTEELD
jgi:RNA polymerase sigma-B factor